MCLFHIVVDCTDFLKLLSLLSIVALNFNSKLEKASFDTLVVILLYYFLTTLNQSA